jgi:hypothetical protein
VGKSRVEEENKSDLAIWPKEPLAQFLKDAVARERDLDLQAAVVLHFMRFRGCASVDMYGRVYTSRNWPYKAVARQTIHR